MSSEKATPRRKRVPGRNNQNVYARSDGKFEVGYRDSSGRQRWKIDGFPSRFDTITAAREARDVVLGKKASGQQVVPSPKLKFGEVADRWLAEPVSELRTSTRTTYEGHVRLHLGPRWGNRKVDTITVSDCAALVRELRAENMSEWTITGIVGVAGMIFRFAARHCGWTGQDPTALMLSTERPKVSQTQQRRIYTDDELAQVLAVTTKPWTTLFRLASVIGGRQAELLGLHWSDLDLDDLDTATVRFAFQLDRAAKKRVELKTEESKAVLPLPRSVALMLLQHKARSSHTGPKAYVFATTNGTPLHPRNALRALYRAQEDARTPDGTPTFPELYEHDERGHLVVNESGAYVLAKVKRRELRLPHFHSMRHIAAMSCDDVEEARDLLRHRNSTVTAKVYRAHFSDQRRESLRAKLEARHGAAGLEAPVEATDRTEAPQTATAELAAVRQLRA